MKKILGILLCLLSVNCFADEKEITPTPLQAAIVDTATTIVALNNGFQEINPLGFPVVTAGKFFVVLYLNDKFEGEFKYEAEKIESSAWTGASVNNLLLVIGATPFIAIGSGLMTAIAIWNNN